MPSKPIAPGDPITWTQYFGGERYRETETRTGIVWSEAMLDTGLGNGWWVIPDSAEDYDMFSVIYVGRASCNFSPYRYPGTPDDAIGPARYEIYSSTRPSDSTAVRMLHAWKVQRDTRESNRTPIAA